jgi:hypothetical protein
MLLMGQDDALDTKSYTFAGLSDIYDKFCLDIAGAAEIPVTKLFGRSPAGMNATGESDMQNYDDKISQTQEADLAPTIDKLLPVLCMSEWGYIPDDLDYTFNPNRSMSNKDKVDFAEKGSETIGKAYERSLIGRKTALKEFRQQSNVTGIFSNITDEDIDNADNELFGAGEVLPDFPQLQGLDAEFNESNHPRDKDGKFGSGEGSCQASSSKVSDAGANKFAKGFSKNNLRTHMTKHGREYPGMNDQQYAQRALDLVQQPVGGDIHGHSNSKEQVVRYDARENDFVKGKPDVGIATMFKPASGLNYYIRQKSRDKKESD